MPKAQGHELIHERCDESKRWVFQRGVMRSSGPIFRIPGGDRVAVKVGAVQVEKLKVNTLKSVGPTYVYLIT